MAEGIWTDSDSIETMTTLTVNLSLIQDDQVRNDLVYYAQNVSPAGRIQSPGKFEGEPLWVPYFWSGESDETEYDDDQDLEDSDCIEYESTSTEVYHVSDDDRAIFPELADVTTVYLWESDQGFVYHDWK